MLLRSCWVRRGFWRLVLLLCELNNQKKKGSYEMHDSGLRKSIGRAHSTELGVDLFHAYI